MDGRKKTRPGPKVTRSRPVLMQRQVMEKIGPAPGRKKTRPTQMGTSSRPMLNQRQVVKKYGWQNVKHDVMEFIYVFRSICSLFVDKSDSDNIVQDFRRVSGWPLE